MKKFYLLTFFLIFFSGLGFKAIAQCRPSPGSVSPIVSTKNDSGKEMDSGGLILLGYSASPKKDFKFPYNWEWRKDSKTGAILASGTVAGPYPAEIRNGEIKNLNAGTYILVTCDADGKQVFNTFTVLLNSNTSQNH